MRKEDEYRCKAAETVHLANKASANADKGRLLCLAEKWLDLADVSRHPRRKSRYTVEHPLVAKTFGNHWRQVE
jgi:hypothetical protein